MRLKDVFILLGMAIMGVDWLVVTLPQPLIVLGVIVMLLGIVLSATPRRPSQ